TLASSCLVRIVAALLAAGCAMGFTAQDVPRGMNFNFYSIDKSAIADCAKTGKGATFRESPRLTGYNQPDVRKKSQEDLAQLAIEGVRWVRTIVWFAPKRTAPLAFVEGEDDGKAKANLAALSADLTAAGITDWIVAFGPQGAASTICRAK